MINTQNTNIGDALYALARQMILGDMTVRRQSVEHLGVFCLLPTLLTARRMRAGVSLFLSVEEGLIFDRREWHPVDGKVFLTIEPTLESTAKAPPQMTLRPPSLLCGAGEGGPLVIRLPSDKFLWVSFKNSNVTTAWGDNADHRPAASEFVEINKWPRSTPYAFLMAMESWVRNPSETPALQFNPDAAARDADVEGSQGNISHILNQIQEGYERLQNLLSLKPSEADSLSQIKGLAQELKIISPDLVPFYRVEELNGRISLWLTKEGKVADDADSERAIKIAFDLRWIGRQNRDELNLRPFPADFLVEGPLHRKMIEAIKNKAAIYKHKRELSGIKHAFTYYVLGKGMAKAGFFKKTHKKEIDRFFTSGAFEKNTAIIRVQRLDEDDDIDVAFIRGKILAEMETEAWLIFRMEVTDFSEEKPYINKVKLIAGFDGGKRYFKTKDAQKRLPFINYIKRVLVTLGAWNRALNAKER